MTFSRSIKLLAASAVLMALAAQSQAAPVTLTEVRSSTGFQSFTMDPVTGKYYRKSTYAYVSSLTEYANRSQFEANVSSGTIGLSPNAAGPYVTVNDGDLYARDVAGTNAAPVTTKVWNLSTGGTTASSAGIGTIGGGNNGFTWGGYSNGNFLQDSTGVYYMGSSTNSVSSTWEIHKVDADLNSTASRSFSVAAVAANGTHPGFAFMIGGKLLIGEYYNHDFITGILDFATGALSIVNLEVDGNWGGSYWNNTFYDSNDDVLYMNNSSNSKLYKLEDAADAFGIELTAIPEPTTLALYGLGLLGLGAARYRRKAA